MCSQERLGIYIKSVVAGGAADADGRLQAGDQLLRVDGQSLIGITQERAADYLVRTGPIVTLEVAKQGLCFELTEIDENFNELFLVFQQVPFFMV